MITPIASSTCIFALLLVSRLMIAPSSAISEADVAAVCAKTLDRFVCSDYLHKVPNLSTASFSEVCKVTVTQGMADAEGTLEFIRRLLQQPEDPHEKMILESCGGYYDSAIGYLGNALQALAEGNYRVVRFSVASGLAFGLNCQREIQGTDIPGLKQENDDLVNYCSIAMELAEHLLKLSSSPTIKSINK